MNSDSDVELSRDEALLHQLEREKEQIESRNHDGFTDAGIRNRIEDEISELARKISQIREQTVESEGYGS